MDVNAARYRAITLAIRYPTGRSKAGWRVAVRPRVIRGGRGLTVHLNRDAIDVFGLYSQNRRKSSGSADPSARGSDEARVNVRLRTVKDGLVAAQK